MSTTPPTRQSSFGLAIAGVVAHVGLVMALFALLAFITPAAKKQFDEYGMTLPWLTISVIRISNWVAEFWWALVPAILLSGIGDFALMLAMSARSRALTLTFLLCVSLGLTAAVAVTVTAIELPKAKLREGLSR